MWDMYVDAIYKPEEISHLREECLKVQSVTDNVEALSGVMKLVRCCDEAAADSYGLSLYCD